MTNNKLKKAEEPKPNTMNISEKDLPTHDIYMINVDKADGKNINTFLTYLKENRTRELLICEGISNNLIAEIPKSYLKACIIEAQKYNNQIYKEHQLRFIISIPTNKEKLLEDCVKIALNNDNFKLPHNSTAIIKGEEPIN